MKRDYIFYIQFPYRPIFKKGDIMITNGIKASKVLVLKRYCEDNYWKRLLRILGIKTYINTCKCKIINNGK